MQNADDEKKVSEFKDISIDVGMSKEKIKKIVSLGDKVTFKRNFTPLLNSQLSASCLDDRAGIASISKGVDEFICVDVSFAYTPNCDKADCGEIGKGAMIGFSPILDKNISKKLVNIAKKNNIPYQCEIMSGSTGTNADVISLCESGIKGALISIPEKYMHQPCEVVDVNDIESVSNLIYAYISEKAGEPNA